MKKSYKLHEEKILELNPTNEGDLAIEMFNGALRRLSLKHAQKYVFTLKGGSDLRNL